MWVMPIINMKNSQLIMTTLNRRVFFSLVDMRRVWSITLHVLMFSEFSHT